ncbi:MAG: glutamate-5-semialdehyde dehydrogenase [Bellilinea sp.]|jgi:glutamate-5-semialdehyde dehydrogenase
MIDLIEIGKQVKQSAHRIAVSPEAARNQVLRRLADLLQTNGDEIVAANQLDLKLAKRNGLSQAMLERLTLHPARLDGIAADLRQVAALPDPVGEIFEPQVLENGLRVHKQRVPLGVLGVIYESRPNVTLDVTGLALKSGNAVILRGGSEAIHSNRALVSMIQKALQQSGLPVGAVQFIDDPDRKYVLELLKLHEYVDLIIPRGGARLHQFCKENSQIPVVVGGIGICHLYIDETADLSKSVEVIFNAKTQRPSVCNALDTILVHPNAAGRLLPVVFERLGNAGVTFRATREVFNQLGIQPDERIQVAGAPDFDTEWLALVLGVKIVSGLEEAIAHIQRHSTGHSDGILSQDQESIAVFIDRIDSAAVYVNASTRFTDGGQLGLGAEVAVSTQRLHARGPMGLRELTTYKWVIQGDGHVRA